MKDKDNKHKLLLGLLKHYKCNSLDELYKCKRFNKDMQSDLQPSFYRESGKYTFLESQEFDGEHAISLTNIVTRYL